MIPIPFENNSKHAAMLAKYLVLTLILINAVLVSFSSAWAEEELQFRFQAGDAGQTVQTASDAKKVTTILGLYRYPKGTSDISMPAAGVQMLDKLALRSDVAITFWWRIEPPWDDSEETWQVEHLGPPGVTNPFPGGILIRYFVKIVDVNGQEVKQYCFEGIRVATGEIIEAFCRESNLWSFIEFGVLWRPNHLDKIGFYSVDYTHNGQKEFSDSYLLADFEILNPNPGGRTTPLLDGDGRVITDISRIAGTSVSSYVALSAAADGLTPLIMRAGTVPAVPVIFRITSEDTQDGSLTSLDGSQGPTTEIQPFLQPLSEEEAFTGVIYTVPPEFAASPTNNPSRNITLEAEFQIPGQDIPAIVRQKLNLIHTPVILIHGMWSSPGTWKTLLANPLFVGTRDTAVVNWSPGETGLLQNVKVVDSTVKNFVQGMRNQKVALTQVDVVAHSAGGQLARLWTQSSDYKRVNNLMAGDFRKIVTIGTPHEGSEVAVLVQDLLNASSLEADLLNFVFDNVIHRSLTRGIVIDQQPNSAVLQSLLPTPVPSQAWIGEALALPSKSQELRMWRKLADLCGLEASQSIQHCQGINGAEDYDILRASVFSDQSNDGIVVIESQAGGVEASARRSLSDTTHTQETRAGNFVSQIHERLDSETEFDVGGFP